jgi:glycosyltransferase involved in cell wall biosynthesis
MKCAVVIPTHKSTLDEREIASLKNTLKILAAWDFFIVLPHGVSADYYQQFRTDSVSLSIVNLEPGFLGSVENYNAMGLSSRFYKRFEDFEYVLICHLDAWVFRDDLGYWMSKGYDYIGAPLFLPELPYYARVFDLAVPVGGNGGLCLRRTKKMLEITEGLKVRFNYLLFVRAVVFLFQNRRFRLIRFFSRICRAIRSDHVGFQRRHNVNEDVTISVLYALLDPSLRVAPPNVSKMFCLEMYMEEITNTGLKLKLPFGVHGYDKYISDHGFQALLRRQTSAYANAPSPDTSSGGRATTTPLVTVVTVIKNIVKNNRVETLKQCIESVRRQSYPHIEHLIIDGASDDGTLELLKQYNADSAGTFKIHSAPDKGLWDAMDKSVALASGEFVNFLNSDDYFGDDDAVKIAVEMTSKEKADWFFSDATVVRADGSSYAYPTTIYGVFACWGIVHQTVFVRRDILEAAAPFASPYRTKENYLFMLLILNDFRYSYCPRPLVHYREGGFSLDEYCGSNLELTKNDFADYFYELAGRRWRMSRLDCYNMLGWDTFGKKDLIRNVLLGFKLGFVGLRLDYFRRLIKHELGYFKLLRRRGLSYLMRRVYMRFQIQKEL